MARAHRITAAQANEARWKRHHEQPGIWFWQRVDQSKGNLACWPWMGRTMTNRRGYGRLVFKGKTLGAHRFALILSSGEDRPSEFACHSCDNPVCCNPRHLFWGTHQENMDDCVAKGRKRGAPPKIDMNRLAQRRGEGASYSILAAEFGVNQASIGKALNRLRARAALQNADEAQAPTTQADRAA